MFTLVRDGKRPMSGACRQKKDGAINEPITAAFATTGLLDNSVHQSFSA